MEELVKAIEKLSQKNIIDYLLVVVPIIVSIVAIYISIDTAKKQNKIALFEKRYDALFQLYTIASFANAIKESDNPNPNLILVLFDAYWGTDIINSTGIQKSIRAKCQLNLITTQVSQVQFLFNTKSSVDPNCLINQLHTIIIKATKDEISIGKINEFCYLCENFYKKDLPKLKNKIKF